MFNKNIYLLGSLIMLSSAAAVAQTPFFQAPPKTANSPAGSVGPIGGTLNKVVSPSDFSNNTAKINTQNSAQFKQQLNQQLSQVPQAKPQIPGAYPKSNAQPSSSAPASQGPFPPAASNTDTSTDMETDNTTTTPPAPGPEMQPSTTTTTPPAPSSIQRPVTQTTSRPSNYTGFSGGGSNAPASGQSSGGWGVKY